MTPAAMPMISEPLGSTKPEAGVIATSPATAPEMMPRTLGFPLSAHSTNIQVSAAVAVAICVTAIAMPAAPFAATAEPGLKADPAAPQQRGADDPQPQIVRRHRLGAVPPPFAEHERCHQPGNP